MRLDKNVNFDINAFLNGLFGDDDTKSKSLPEIVMERERYLKQLEDHPVTTWDGLNSFVIRSLEPNESYEPYLPKTIRSKLYVYPESNESEERLLLCTPGGEDDLLLFFVIPINLAGQLYQYEHKYIINIAQKYMKDIPLNAPVTFETGHENADEDNTTAFYHVPTETITFYTYRMYKYAVWLFIAFEVPIEHGICGIVAHEIAHSKDPLMVEHRNDMKEYEKWNRTTKRLAEKLNSGVFLSSYDKKKLREQLPYLEKYIERDYQCEEYAWKTGASLIPEEQAESYALMTSIGLDGDRKIQELRWKSYRKWMNISRF